MQAIILAAGMGKRLGSFTSENTKCMVKVNGERLIYRMLSQLEKLNLSRIIIVTGYKGENLQQYVRSKFSHLNISFINNSIYDQTNNIYSLWLAREYMAQDETLLLESDLIFKPLVIQKLIHSKYRDCALVSKYATWMDGTMVTLDDDKNIVNFIPKKAFDFAETQRYYKTVNIYKFSKEFINKFYLPLLEAYIKVLGQNEYYEQVLRVISFMDAVEIKAIEVGGQDWYEIDDVQDLRIAETIFALPAERLKQLTKVGGGYWRYQNLLDLAHLTNPYFPTIKIANEIKANFEQLLTHYPSNLTTLSHLVRKNCGISTDCVNIGSSTTLFISQLIEFFGGITGFVTPIIKDYIPPTPKQKELMRDSDEASPYRYYSLPNNDENLEIMNLITWMHEEDIKTLVVQSPNFWNGQSIGKEDLLKLIYYCDRYNKYLILDNSLAEFCNQDYDIFNFEFLKNPHLIVVKDCSIIYGIPGLKLSIACAGNLGVFMYLAKMENNSSTNSFSEFFMQIYSKYEKDFQRSIMLLKKQQHILECHLTTISFLTTVSSSYNYILCRVNLPITAYKLRLTLLNDYKILVTDGNEYYSEKGTGEYIRISIGTEEENERLVNALKHIERNNPK